MNIGQYLKQERELRGITLGQVADATKISLHHLSEMEFGRIDSLPSRVYAKGFIRAYAKAVGLDEEDVLLRYEEEENERRLAAGGEVKEAAAKRLPKIKFGKKTVFFIIAAIVIILAVVFSSR